ncbi:MAG: Na+ dependent nucleoside transporter N-terminal domain-containing protein, partial [Croceibacterium sp.]
MPHQMISLAGIAAILLLAFLLSVGKRRIRLRVVGSAFALQALLALLIVRTPWGQATIQAMANGVAALLSYADEGTAFLFGAKASNPLGNTFALGALPVIIFFAALVSILYHLGIMQRVVRWVGGAIGWVTGISRVESLAAAANIFVG